MAVAFRIRKLHPITETIFRSGQGATDVAAEVLIVSEFVSCQMGSQVNLVSNLVVNARSPSRQCTSRSVSISQDWSTVQAAQHFICEENRQNKI